MVIVFSQDGRAVKGQSGNKAHSRVTCLGWGKEGSEQVRGIRNDDQVNEAS
jgi:hypothetical protein